EITQHEVAVVVGRGRRLLRQSHARKHQREGEHKKCRTAEICRFHLYPLYFVLASGTARPITQEALTSTTVRNAYNTGRESYMAREIEHKFIVDTRLWKPRSTGIRIEQGYLSTEKERVVRVRIFGERAALTIKGETRGLAREEFEYEIPTG